MVQIFYTIFNDNDELLFANNTQYNTKEEAVNSLLSLYKKLLPNKNIEILEHTKEILKFIDLPRTELEGKEFHTFTIMKGAD